MDINLAQRGRALIDWEITARQTANVLHARGIAELAEKGLTDETLPDEMDERHDAIDAALQTSTTYHARRLLAEWCAKNHGLAAQEAFEEVRADVIPTLEALRTGPCTLEVLPHFQMPKYFERVWFHRTAGGWDANEYNGFIHGKLVNEIYLTHILPGDSEADRQRVIDTLPVQPYHRILEIGTSSGYFTRSLAKRLPDAEIVGVDPSLRMLEQAQRVGNELGLSWKLYVGLGEDTRFGNESFDLVTAHIVNHELPPGILRLMFEEALRLLRPGGVVMFADVPPYRLLSKLAAWSFDWVARYHGEPYWRAAANLDLEAEVKKVGFVDVVVRGLSPVHFPYVVLGRKPG